MPVKEKQMFSAKVKEKSTFQKYTQRKQPKKTTKKEIASAKAERVNCNL